MLTSQPQLNELRTTLRKPLLAAKIRPHKAGPRDIVLEIALAEHDDADKYDVEGIILGVSDKACPASPSSK